VFIVFLLIDRSLIFRALRRPDRLLLLLDRHHRRRHG
jgi:hypothetical protein